MVPLLGHPRRSAVLCDIDGTLAPIVAQADRAEVPERARALCGSRAATAWWHASPGRPAKVARRMVGDRLDRLRRQSRSRAPGSVFRAGRSCAGASAVRAETGGVRRRLLLEQARDLGVELEDKRSIQSFHWREAPRTSRQLAGHSSRSPSGLPSRAWPRTGVARCWRSGRRSRSTREPRSTALLRDTELTAAIFIGDDTTDIDAFHALHGLREEGVLDHAVGVGVLSQEGPVELDRRRPDGRGHGRSGAASRETHGRSLSPQMRFTDFLKATVLLTAGEATALAASRSSPPPPRTTP